MLTEPWNPPGFILGVGHRDFWNAVMSYSGQSIQIPGKSGAVVFDQTAVPPGDARVHRLTNRAGERLYLKLQTFPFHSMFKIELTYADIASLADPLRMALYDGVLAFIASAFPDDSVADLTWDSVGSLSELCDSCAADSLCWLEGRLSGIAPEEIVVTLGVKPQILFEILRTDSLAGMRVWGELGKTLTAPAYVQAGECTLTLDELRNLNVGDALMLSATDTVRFVNVGRTTFELSRNELGWLCSGVLEAGSGFINGGKSNHEGDSMETDQTLAGESNETASEEDHATRDGERSTSPADKPIQEPSLEPIHATTDSTPFSATAINEQTGSLDDILPVKIEFGFAEQQVPLAEIETWQPGAIVELEIPEHSGGLQVDLRANGQVIGAGELVKIDDRIAVRISKLLFKTF